MRARTLSARPRARRRAAPLPPARHPTRTSLCARLIDGPRLDRSLANPARLDDLCNAATARRIHLAVDDEVDRGGNRLAREPGTDVASDEERERGELHQSVSCRARVDGRRSGNAGVECQEQIERL